MTSSKNKFQISEITYTALKLALIIHDINYASEVKQRVCITYNS